MSLTAILKSSSILYIVINSFFAFINCQKNEFKIYWNVPTFQCHKYGLNFTNIQNYGIIQNDNDKFRGEKITILYDPGFYPAIINGKNRNGGVPQQGDINKHLNMFKNDLERAIPDSNFKGIGIIDFEHWRPVYRENWAKLDVYRQKSREIIEKKFPYLNRSSVDKMASKSFEKAAFSFMDETLALAVKLRPKAKWGYYAYPYCFNFTPKNFRKECTKEVEVDNDRSTWMYKTGTAVFPSIYLQQKVLNEAKREKLIEYRVLEGKRMVELSGAPLKQYLYAHYKYPDTGAFLSKVDMQSSLLVPKKSGADGVIIWGSTNDVNTIKKCTQLNDYVENVIGPIIKTLNLTKKKLISSNEV